MAPYLKQGDMVLVNTMNTSPLIGSLVLLSREGKLIVHRYHGEGKIKGDRIPEWDNKLDPQLEVLGVVTHRIVPHTQKKWVTLEDRFHRHFFSLFTYLAKKNNSLHFLKKTTFSLVFSIIGNGLRIIDILLARKERAS